MFLAKHLNGNYYIYYKNKFGKRTCKSTKTRKKDKATEYMLKFRQNLEDSIERKCDDITLIQLIFVFNRFKEPRCSPRTMDSFKSAYSLLRNKIGDYRIVYTITTLELENVIIEQTANRSPYSARRYRMDLITIFEFALKNKYHHINPARAILPFKLPEMRVFAYTKEQFKGLINVIKDKTIQRIVRFAGLTGFRQSEILSLRWDNIDFLKKVIVFHNRGNFITKSKCVKEYDIAEATINLLLKIKSENGTCDFVFNEYGRQIDPKKFSRDFGAKNYVGLIGITDSKANFHAIRHSFVTWLIQDGVSLYKINKMTGHSPASIALTAQYVAEEKIDCKKEINLLNDLGEVEIS